MMQQKTDPIGIFDSGVGGLTVVRALVSRLPNENIIYFGDTAHFPYGDKSEAALCNYASEIAQFLLSKKVKLILIACHTASSVAFETVKKIAAGKALVLNVIDPTVELLRQQHATARKIGIIATKQTIASGVYQKRIAAALPQVAIAAHATPILAPVIEEGFAANSAIDHILEVYLNHISLVDIDALVLACTHYPLVKDKIAAFYAKKPIAIIDPSVVVAAEVLRVLASRGLLNDVAKSYQHFYVSDATDAFLKNARLFFGAEIVLETQMPCCK